jgi:hypothetical protein
MPLGKQDLSARLHSSYEKLASSALSLNAATDELTKIGASFDAALKRLNLGIESWVQISEGSDELGTKSYYSQLGYSKIGGKWGIALRNVECDEQSGEETVLKEWLFADAPRDLRVLAVNRLPELIERLQEEAQDTTEFINATLEQARLVLKTLQEPRQSEVKK